MASKEKAWKGSWTAELRKLLDMAWGFWSTGLQPGQDDANMRRDPGGLCVFDQAFAGAPGLGSFAVRYSGWSHTSQQTLGWISKGGICHWSKTKVRSLAVPSD